MPNAEGDQMHAGEFLCFHEVEKAEVYDKTVW